MLPASLTGVHAGWQVMERRAAADAGVEETGSDASGPREAHPRARSSGCSRAQQ